MKTMKTMKQLFKFSPWWLTGFTQADGRRVRAGYYQETTARSAVNSFIDLYLLLNFLKVFMILN